jgi:anti-sigma B factor antagonist
VAIACEVRLVGEVSVIRCTGSIVMGTESTALFELVEERLARARGVVLQLAGVDYIDSSGLGLLVRLLRRIETAHGRLALCLLPPRVALLLSTTKIHSIFEIHESKEEAIAALHHPRQSEGGSIEFVYPNVLCALESTNLLSYVSELLSQAGYAALSANNLPDASTILRLLAQPKVVISTPEFYAGAEAGFLRLLDTAHVLDLPPEFSTANVDASAQALLTAVRGVIGDPPRAGTSIDPALR